MRVKFCFAIICSNSLVQQTITSLNPEQKDCYHKLVLSHFCRSPIRVNYFVNNRSQNLIIDGTIFAEYSRDTLQFLGADARK